MELHVLADDFAGTLVTGMQYARQSIPNLVSTRIEILDQGSAGEIPVSTIDLEARYLAPFKAAARVRQTVNTQTYLFATRMGANKNLAD